MRDELEALRARFGKHAREFLGRVADLGRIEPDPLDLVEPRLGHRQRRERGVFVEMPQKAQDQLRGQSVLGLGLRHSREQSFDHRPERDPAIGVRLWIEEDFGMHHPVRRRAIEIGGGKVAEIGLGLKHPGTGVIDVEKVLEVGEGIRRAHLFDRGVGDGDPVPLGQREHQLGLKAAFDMQVKLGFWQAGDEGVDVGYHAVQHRAGRGRGQVRKRNVRSGCEIFHVPLLFYENKHDTCCFTD
jgi:hypothetical protein